MSYREEKQVRLRRQGSRQAIALAMQGRWREAVAVNTSLIESFPRDVEAYNRLGKAYLELGEYAQAREAYGKVLEIDHYSTIARKNLRRLSHLGEVAVGVGGGAPKADPQHFIEEVGKAGLVNLRHLAPLGVLARTTAGDRVQLKVDGANLVVLNSHGEYLGQVEPKYGQRLIRLIEGGNEYSAAVVRAAEDVIATVIREVYQDPSQAGQLSFPGRRSEWVQPYASNRVFREELPGGEEIDAHAVTDEGLVEDLPEEVSGDRVDSKE